MAKNKYTSWAKSFGRSVRFGATEVLSELTPNIAETRSSLADDVRELRQDLRKLRANKRQLVNQLLGDEEQFTKYAGIAKKNAISSIKTGNLFNKKREEKLTMQAFGMDDMDFDSDFNDDFDDSVSDGSFEDMDLGPTKIVNMTGPSSRAMMDVSNKVSEATNAINTGFDKQNRANKNTFAISEALQKQFHKESIGQLAAINANLVNIVQYNNETWTKYVTASMEFYDKNLAVLNSINEAMLRVSPVPKQKRAIDQKRSPFDDFMSGGFSLKSYANFVGKNTIKAFQNSMIGSVLPMMNNGMFLSEIAANPVGFALKEVMSAMLPDRFKTSLGNLDKSFNRFIPAALTKLGNYHGTNSFIQLLGEMFGVQSPSMTKRFKQGDYERGPIPFDGDTKSYITRVIPGYLSRQVALLEVIASKSLGMKEDRLEDEIRRRLIVYGSDPNSSTSGSFLRLRDAERITKREEKDKIASRYFDSRWELRDTLGNLKNKKYMDTRMDDIDNYIIGLTKSRAEHKPMDLDQIMRFIYAGEHGEEPKGTDYKKDPDLVRRAAIIKLGFKKIKKKSPHILMGMAGAERIEAQTELSNYYAGYGSDEKHGIGAHNMISQLEKGSMGYLFKDTGGKKTISTKYRLVRNEDGTYYMPDEYLAKYNKDHGKNGIPANFKNAEEVNEDIEKRKGVSNTTIQSNTRTEEKSMLASIKATIAAPFNKMADLFDEVDKKMYEIIFGSDGMGADLKKLIMGEYDKASGRYSGGWFSGAINGVKDTYKSTKEYLFGKQNPDGSTTPGVLSNLTKSFSNLMDEYIFGEDEIIVNPDGTKSVKKRKSIFETIQTTVVHGFGELSSLLFGDDKKGGRARNASLEEAKKAFNKAIPDIGKGAGIGAIVGTISGFGGFGLLGSLFLPGGPIGGAIVGSAIGLLKQSQGFNEMLFGRKEVGKDGKEHRVGGLISERIQNFFKRKRVPILGGAIIGSISTAMGHGIAFGLMPTIAIGAFGPVITGAAWGLMSHSKKFREVFFGREIKGPDGITRRIGGVINNRMIRSLKVSLPRAVAGAITGVASMGVLSQFGLIGSMLATGPIPAAIMGAAIGIASRSKRFTQYMFGYTDASGTYHSGAMDRLKNYFTWEIMEPMKLYLRENVFKGKMWARRYIYAPLREAFIPIKYTLEDIGDYIKDHLDEGWKSISDGFTTVFKTVASKIGEIMDPVIKMTRSIASWTVEKFKSALGITITAALLPLRAMGDILGWMVKGRDYKSGLITAAKGVGTAIMAGSGFVGAMGNLGKAIMHPSDENDRMKKFRRRQEAQRKLEEKAFAKGSLLLGDSRRRMEEQQRRIRDNGYNLTDDQVEAMREAERKRAASIEGLSDQINKSGDLGAKMSAVIAEGQAEANDYLSQMRDSLSSQEDYNRSETGLHYTMMAAVHNGLKKLGIEPDKIKDKFSEVMDETVHPWFVSLSEAVHPIVDAIETKMLDAQGISNIHLKSIDANILNLLSMQRASTKALISVLSVGMGVSMPKQTMDNVMKSLNPATYNTTASPTSVPKQIGGGPLLLGPGKRSYIQSHETTPFITPTYATESQHISTWGIDTKSDDNASVVDAQNKAKKEKDDAKKQEEKKVSFIGTIAEYCKYKLRGKDKDKPSWLEKILKWGGSVLGGLFTLAKIGTGIIGVIGGILALLSFTFGDDKDKKRMIDSEAAGNIVTRFGRSIARKFPKAVESVGKFAYGAAKYAGKGIKDAASKAFDKITDKAKSGWNVAKAADANKGLIANIMQKVENAISSIVNSDIVKKLVGGTSKSGTAHKGLIRFIKDIPKTIATLMRKNKASHLILIGLKKSKATIAKGVAKAVAGGLTGGALTVAFGAYDMASGARRAGFFFDVADEDVDERMRLVAGLVNMIFGLPGMFVFDVSLSLASVGAIGLEGTPLGHWLQEYGFDLNRADYRKIIAQLIYRMTAEEADVSKLEEDQKKLLNEYKAFLDKEGKTPDDMSLEQYQSEVKGQGGFWKNFGAPIINRILGVDVKHKSFMELVEDKFNGLVEWFKKSVDELINFSPLQWLKDEIFKTDFGKRLNSFWNEPWLNTKGQNQAKANNEAITKTGNKLTDLFGRQVDQFSADGNGPYYSQKDSRWKNIPIGSSNMGNEGCGIASMAMASSMLGKNINPKQVAKLTSPGLFSGSGINSGYFRHAASRLGLGYRENRSSNDMLAALKTGTPTIIGGKSPNPNSPFYGNGHYVVAKGLNADGSVKIYNPSGMSKNTNMNVKQLLRESIGSGGYSGSFIGGANGRMSIAEAQAAAMNNERKFDMTSKADLKRYEEEAAKDQAIVAEMTAAAKKDINRKTTYIDEETAAKIDADKGIVAKTDGVKETITKPTQSRVGAKGSFANSGKNRNIGFTELITGFGLGLKNLFSSIWGGTKYQNVSVDDLFGGIGSIFGFGNKGIKVSGKGCDTGIKAAQCALSHPKGEQWMGTVTKNPRIQCDSYAREIYHEAGLEMPRKVVTDEDFKAKHAYHLNNGSYEPQLGDLVDWPGHVGIYVGGHNVNSRQSSGGVQTQSFENAEKIWGPIVGFGSVSEYTGEPVHEVKGSSASIDTSSGRIETKKAVWSYLVNDLGINRAGAAGIMGNIEQESGFRTEAYNPNDNDGNPSGGLVQWHAGRFNRLKDFAASKGTSWEDVNAQMNYLAQELDEEPYKSYVFDKVQNAPDVGSAVDAWVRHFEIPANIPGEIEKRTPIADAYYKDTANFVGGANGFMNGSSGNILGNVIAGGLFDWGNRYRERGIAKRQMANAMAQYAASQGRPQIRNPQIVNVANTRVLPSKIDTGGASMDDLLLSIRALDNHGELREIIAYLATIAKNGGVGGNNIPIDDKTATQIRREIEQVKRSVSESKVPHRLNQAGMRNFNNAMDSIDGMPSNMLQLAKSIAHGGKFRTS